MADSEFTTDELLNEEWRDVTGYEKLYAVSNLGRVKFYPKPHARKDNFSKNIRISRCGYGEVRFSKTGDKRRIFLVHRLVGSAFLKKPDDPEKVQINHKDGIKHNNRAHNLEWCDRFENQRHAVKMGLAACGEKHYRAKITEDDVLNIRWLRSQGVPQRQITKLYDIAVTTVGHIEHRRSWKCIP